jgi:predicted small lipoprotein YifL
MKKGILRMVGFMLLLLLAACGDNDEVKNPPQNTTEENQQQTDESNTNTTDDTGADTNTAYGFTSFDLDADYNETNDALDVDYENEKNDKMEASYLDKAQDINLNGDAAMDELDGIFSSFTFDENTSDEEVLSTVARAFNIPEDAQTIELEIQFGSGTEKEYRK